MSSMKVARSGPGWFRGWFLSADAASLQTQITPSFMRATQPRSGGKSFVQKGSSPALGGEVKTATQQRLLCGYVSLNLTNTTCFSIFQLPNINIVIFITMSNPQRVVMTELMSMFSITQVKMEFSIKNIQYMHFIDKPILYKNAQCTTIIFSIACFIQTNFQKPTKQEHALIILN